MDGAGRTKELNMEQDEFYLLNAFTGENAKGNPACVILLDDISDTDRLHKLARSFNQPATTFLKKRDVGYDVRWFAPDAEIPLCGHGTVAATWLFTKILKQSGPIEFHYAGGVITGSESGDQVVIEGEAIQAEEQPIPEHVVKGFHGKAVGYWGSGEKNIVLLDSEESVRTMEPDWNALRGSRTFGYVITAQGSDYDCVSRVMLPYVSFLEDQATGSAHMLLAPYWSKRLNKSRLDAFQASERGGHMICEVDNDRVRLLATADQIGHGIYHS
ncbi:MAG: PhzF family phenazine biosynthesis protein [Flavobacteriales bacterium]